MFRSRDAMAISRITIPGHNSVQNNTHSQTPLQSYALTCDDTSCMQTATNMNVRSTYPKSSMKRGRGGRPGSCGGRGGPIKSKVDWESSGRDGGGKLVVLMMSSGKQFSKDDIYMPRTLHGTRGCPGLSPRFYRPLVGQVKTFPSFEAFKSTISWTGRCHASHHCVSCHQVRASCFPHCFGADRYHLDSIHAVPDQTMDTVTA
jgi:hypothetical protein